MLNRVQLFVTPWTIAHQAPLSMTVSGQEYWSGLLFPTPWDLPDPGIEATSPESPELQADSLPLESLGMPNERNDYHHVILPILLVSLSDFLKSPQGIRSERGPGFWWLLLPEMPEEDNIGRRGPHSSTISLQAQQT